MAADNHTTIVGNPTEDEWRLVERAVGIDRGWNAPISWSPPSTRPGGAADHRTPDGSQLLFLALRVRLRRAKAQTPRPLLPRFAVGVLGCLHNAGNVAGVPQQVDGRGASYPAPPGQLIGPRAGLPARGGPQMTTRSRGNRAV
jgi:hypothetical protein